LPPTFTLDACRHGGMTVLEPIEERMTQRPGKDYRFSLPSLAVSFTGFVFQRLQELP
jgi:hypothetical protein